jgi:hypothetical protein
MARLATFSAFMLLAGSATAQGVARGSGAAVRAMRCGDARVRRRCDAAGVTGPGWRCARALTSLL